jgi:hypothetical protein
MDEVVDIVFFGHGVDEVFGAGEHFFNAVFGLVDSLAVVQFQPFHFVRLVRLRLAERFRLSDSRQCRLVFIQLQYRVD